MDSSKDIKDIQYNKNNKKENDKKENNKKERKPENRTDKKNENRRENGQENNQIRNILNQININGIIAFIRKHARYFAAGVLFLLLLLVLVFFTGEKADGNAEGVGETGAAVFSEDAYPEVNELIQYYYTAYAAGDIETLLSLAAPVSEKEQRYISIFSQYVESYDNMVIYATMGLDASSYMANVYYEAKFTGVDTRAPGLDFFYIRTNEDGSLYIDNLYSQYNMKNNEYPLDVSVQNLITTYENQEEVIALVDETQLKYDTVVASDENLAAMLNTTIPQAIKDWVAAAVEGSAAAAEGTETAEGTEETEATEVAEENGGQEAENNGQEEQQPEQPEEPSEPETTSETVKTTSKVNVRAAADTSAEKLGTVESGTTLTRTGTEGDWSIVEYNGGSGYIKSEYLTTDTSSETQTGTSAAGALAEGTVVTLENTTNIRSSMSETSDKVGVAYPGEKVTVVMSYAEGWTKVTWNSKTGYIKTELLQ